MALAISHQWFPTGLTCVPSAVSMAFDTGPPLTPPLVPSAALVALDTDPACPECSVDGDGYEAVG